MRAGPVLGGEGVWIVREETSRRGVSTGAPHCCCRKGLTFVSVHDCFWTHAADVAVMNQVQAHPH